ATPEPGSRKGCTRGTDEEVAPLSSKLLGSCGEGGALQTAEKLRRGVLQTAEKLRARGESSKLLRSCGEGESSKLLRSCGEGGSGCRHAGCELYPSPFPDLFCGYPLVIAGKFHGVLPAQITIAGTLPNGQDSWVAMPLHASASLAPLLPRPGARRQLCHLGAWLVSLADTPADVRVPRLECLSKLRSRYMCSPAARCLPGEMLLQAGAIARASVGVNVRV
ncbi:hypothetical protein CYMTET_39882, partial [Cymbomonas tetramitiformis]